MKKIIIFAVLLVCSHDAYSQFFIKSYNNSKGIYIIDSKEQPNKEIVLNISDSNTNDDNIPSFTQFHKINKEGNTISMYPQQDRYYFTIDTFQSGLIAVGYDIYEKNKLVVTFFDNQFNVKKELFHYFEDENLRFLSIYSTIYGNTMLLSGLRSSKDNIKELSYLATVDLKTGNFIEADKYPSTLYIFMDSKLIKDTIYVFNYSTIEKYTKELNYTDKYIKLFLNDTTDYVGPGNMYEINNNLYISGRKFNSIKDTRIMSITKINLGKNEIVKDAVISASNHYHYNGIIKGISYKDPNKIFWTGWDNLGYIPNITYPNDSSHIILAQVDSNLNLKWQRQYGGDAYYMVYGLEALDDGGCLVYGSRYQPGGELKRQGFLLKVNENGELTSVFGPTPKEIISLQPFPNPATTDLTWQLPSDVFKGEIELQLFNSLGQLVKLEHFQPTSDVLKTSITDLPSGIYNWKISDSKHEAKGSVVVVR